MVLHFVEETLNGKQICKLPEALHNKKKQETEMLQKQASTHRLIQPVEIIFSGFFAFALRMKTFPLVSRHN